MLFFADITTVLQDLAGQFIQVVPRLFSSLVLIIVGLIIAKIASNILRKFLEKIQIDKLGEKLNEIEVVSKANLDIKFSGLFSKILYYFLALFFMVAATDVLGMPAVSDTVKGIFNFIPNIIVALIILIIGLLFADAIRKIVQTTCESIGIPSAKLISSFLFYFLFINIVVSALTQAKINTAFLSQNLSLLIGGVILAFAIGYGFASKDVVSNFLASFYSKGKFNIGDIITVDGDKGEVVDLDKTTLTISKGDSKIIYPLSHLTSNKIEIHS